MTDRKLCVNCGYFIERKGTNMAGYDLPPVCGRAEALKLDHIRGNDVQMSCESMRAPMGDCGPTGKLWAAK